MAVTQALAMKTIPALRSAQAERRTDLDEHTRAAVESALSEPAMLELSVKIATCMLMMGNVRDAETGFAYAAAASKQRMESAKGALEANDFALAGLCADHMASFLASQGRSEEALVFFQGMRRWLQASHTHTQHTLSTTHTHTHTPHRRPVDG
jgi:hypothetical protein